MSKCGLLRYRRARAMGCCLSVAADATPILRDLDATAASLLVPPRPLRRGLAWSALSNVRLISDRGGSCNVYSAQLDGESVAVKKWLRINAQRE